jgi:hypothetical protein
MTLLRALCSAAMAFLLAVTVSMSTVKADPDVSVEPDVPVEAENSPPSVGWTQLGLDDKVSLLGSNQTVDVEVPVPTGVTSTAFTGQIGSAVNIAAGTVDVLDARGILLGTIAVPVGLGATPFVVDTSAAEITNGIAKLTFVLRDANPPTTGCSQPPAVVLNQLATTYSGPAPSPATVAEFLPDVLAHIIVKVGPTPDQDAQQAALSLVARLTEMYRPMPVRIDVDTSPDAAGPTPADTRLIEIRPGPDAGLTVENGATPEAALVVSGTGPALLRQVDLFSDRRLSLAQTPRAIVTFDTDTTTKATRTLTFEQLGMTGQVSALGTATLYTAFDASAFGVGPIQQATVHLKARYTPVVGGEGSVLLRAGSTVLGSYKLDGSGTLDFSAEVPAEAITSKTGLALDIRYSPKQDCAPLSDRLTFALDPGSTVSVIPGTDNRGGFPAIPMALTPEFDVAVAAPDQIRYAAQAINLMGQQTTATLRPTVRPFKEAVGLRSALLVVAGPDQLAQSGLQAPIQPGQSKSVTINGSPVTAVDLGGAVGVIQAFTDNGRMVLAVGGSDDWSLLDRSFDYIRGLKDGWASLSGDVVATGPAGTAVNLTVREGGPMAHQPEPAEGWRWWAWLTAAVGGIAALAVIVALVVRRRRGRS